VAKGTSPKIPVLVLRMGVTALGVMRAFGRKVIPVYLISDEADNASMIRMQGAITERTESNVVLRSFSNAHLSLLTRFPND